MIHNGPATIRLVDYHLACLRCGRDCPATDPTVPPDGSRIVQHIGPQQALTNCIDAALRTPHHSALPNDTVACVLTRPGTMPVVRIVLGQDTTPGHRHCPQCSLGWAIGDTEYGYADDELWARCLDSRWADLVIELTDAWRARNDPDEMRYLNDNHDEDEDPDLGEGDGYPLAPDEDPFGDRS